MRGQFLVEISPDGRPAPGRLVPADLAELNGRFRTWVEREYHLRTHSETGTTPLARWATAQPRRVSGPELEAAFLWESTRSAHAQTATIKFHKNVYEVDPRLAGRRVTLAYSPFDLTGDTVPIQISYRDTAYGTAKPLLITSRTHPKVKTVPRPELSSPPTPTGINYLDLLEHQRTAADGTAHCIAYRDLTTAHTDAPNVTDINGQPS